MNIRGWMDESSKVGSRFESSVDMLANVYSIQEQTPNRFRVVLCRGSQQDRRPGLITSSWILPYATSNRKAQEIHNVILSRIDEYKSLKTSRSHSLFTQVTVFMDRLARRLTGRNKRSIGTKGYMSDYSFFQVMAFLLCWSGRGHREKSRYFRGYGACFPERDI